MAGIFVKVKPTSKLSGVYYRTYSTHRREGIGGGGRVIACSFLRCQVIILKLSNLVTMRLTNRDSILNQFTKATLQASSFICVFSL